MKVIWEVDAGYVPVLGKGRPQVVEIPDEYFAKGDWKANEEERQEIIVGMVQADFDQKITWAIVRIEE